MRRPAVAIVLDRSLTALAYRCHPDGCPRDRSCCMTLVLEATRREVRVIDSLMDELARLVPSLRDGDDYASVFVDDPPHLVVESGDDGACPFLYRTRRHALCAIHSVALASGRRVAEVKPAACRHWPLALEPAPGGRVRITVQPAARRMGCVAPVATLPGHPRVIDAFRDEIAELRAVAAGGGHGRRR
ncbi:MAG: hypothetical protein U0807_07500 [Candidatus Binatia bacterium]